MIAPQTHFDLKLPVSTWQGRYLQNGCGGYCGERERIWRSILRYDARGRFRDGDGRRGPHNGRRSGGAGLFAFNDQKLRNEYGYESEQALYVVAREIVKDYYGVDPNYSYYDGMLGRRARGDGDGRALSRRLQRDHRGRPGDHRRAAERRATDMADKVNTDSNGNAILTAAQLPVLHQTVINQCQGDDGVPGDGIITDPRSCHPDLTKAECGTIAPPCLTPAQIQVAEKIYQGQSIRKVDGSIRVVCRTAQSFPGRLRRSGRAGPQHERTRVRDCRSPTCATSCYIRGSSAPIRASGSSTTPGSDRCSLRPTRSTRWTRT